MPKDETDNGIDSDESDNGVEIREAKPCGRRIQIDWPEPPVDWPEINVNWEESYPVLLIPTYAGQQAMYDPETQTVFAKNNPPSNDLDIDGEKVLLGELHDGSFVANDIFDEDKDANSRVYELVNLPPEDDIEVVRPVQVSDADNFNKYLESFKAQGYVGVFVRHLDDTNDVPQFLVIKEV